MRILVVEDEQDLLESLVEGLRLNSYAVDGCDDGCKAMSWSAWWSTIWLFWT